ncbi:MAG: hypothetical protein LBU43_00975, partial [Candidatus Accumulibacter sp.]|nr:hypothetical protein [Accumulibacter sp.]
MEMRVNTAPSVSLWRILLDNALQSEKMGIKQIPFNNQTALSQVMVKVLETVKLSQFATFFKEKAMNTHIFLDISENPHIIISNKQQATSNKQQATSNKQQATSNKQQ